MIFIFDFNKKIRYVFAIYDASLVVINRAGGLYGRLLTEVASTAFGLYQPSR